MFPQNDTNATLKCPQDRSLHRPTLFNCKESLTSHIFHKNKKGGKISPTAKRRVRYSIPMEKSYLSRISVNQKSDQCRNRVL